MKSIITTCLILGLTTVTANASIFDQLRDSAPRSVFDDIRDSAPRSVFDDLRNSAPKSAIEQDQLNHTAPRSDGIFGSLQNGAP